MMLRNHKGKGVSDEVVDTFIELLHKYDEPIKSESQILMHPDVYKVIEDYKNQNPLQRFVWNLKWGFKDCAENFRNWQGHMIGEDWDFWEILSGEWSSYE